MYKSECLVEPGCYCSLCLLQTSFAEPTICYSIKRSCCLTKRCAWNMSQCHWSNGKCWFSVKLNVKKQAGNHWLTLHLHTPSFQKVAKKAVRGFSMLPFPLRVPYRGFLLHIAPASSGTEPAGWAGSPGRAGGRWEAHPRHHSRGTWWQQFWIQMVFSQGVTFFQCLGF